jgi:amino acid adenylation domain-containing protein
MNNSTNKIAVVGMSCRFPGAGSVEEYWNNLIMGKETLTHFSDEEIAKVEPYFDKLKNNPDYVRMRGALKDVDKFDAAFFGITPREASETDPQQRMWFETAWEALENAGIDPYNYPGAIGVYAGGAMSSYLLSNILRDPQRMANYFNPHFGSSGQIMNGNDISYMSTKTAYYFDLKGPAVYVQTACSTSLVAIAQACQSLYSYDSDVCLAGGVRIYVPQEKGYMYQEGAISSPDGHCRPFDEKAKGTVGGNGVGVVVLKRMEDAIRDNDTIYALVSGWALNNDGSNKVSFAAPSVDGQAEVIMMAQSFAEVSPEEIGYVEAHGTATQLGDPIEMAGLTKAFSAKTNKKQFCGIGSVKSNIGHTDAAAGVASFIKVCLSAYYKKIPPSLHYIKPNPHIDFENSPFYVLNHVKEWTDEKPLIIGVSSFGIGGTNAHVIVEQPPLPETEAESKSEWPELIVLSAKTEDSLKQQKQNLAEFLKTRTDLNINDVANTLAFGRNHMQNRSFMVASTIEEIVSGEKAFIDGKKDCQLSKIAFMFPGQGAQYARMGKDLYQKNKTFRDILDKCFSIFKSETGEDMKAILFADDKKESDRRLARTELTQPALFIIEYALAKVLEQIDIRPNFFIGHSIGEYAAACLSGVFDLPSALRVVIKRGQLMSKMPSGNMMAVRKDIEKLKAISGSNFEIAADNASEACTISFKTEDTEKVKALLDENKIQYIPLNTSHAFHSATFDPILSEFRDYVNQFNLKNPDLPFISCLTGTYITNEQATSGAYWAQQLRNTVSFHRGIAKIAENEEVIFLEVGPNTHLSSLVRQSKDIINKKQIISTLGKGDDSDEQYKVLAALGNMYNAGFNINFEVFSHGINCRKIGLPTYPFEKRRHWIDFDFSALSSGDDSSQKGTDKGKLHTDDNIYNRTDIDEKYGPEGINEKIAGIWESLLGSDKIGLDDDFYEIGGHSLLALQILTRMKEELGIKITLKEFLDNPTINKLNAQFGFESLKPEQNTSIAQTVDISNFPLSYTQRSIWIISKLDVINPAYNIPFSYKITGELNIDVFEEAINVLFNRHFVIFSTFKEKDGNPVCEILPKPINVELLDYSKKPKEKSEKEILSFISKDTRKLFDLENGPLYRIFLSKQSDLCYFFHGTIHHIVFDGWSFSVFFNDLRKIYESLIQNKEPKLEDVKEYYIDFATSLKSADNESIDQTSAKYWIDNLKGCNPKLNFPYDFPRKDSTSGYGEKENIRLPVECTARLKEIAKKEHATPFAAILSLIGVLFHRYSGENDICIGTHVANRPSSGLERIFGMFVNTIPIRLQIDDSQKISNLINSTKDVLLESIAHQEFPFEKIVEVLNPERYSNMNPIFQVAVQWITYSTKPLKFVGFSAERVDVSEGISPFDITFNLWENDGQIEGEVEYNIDILKRDTIIRMRNNFIKLVQSAVENPNKAISNISIVSENDQKLLSEFNNTETDILACLVQELFEAQVGVHAAKTAVIFGDSALTYKELNKKANQVARHLLTLEVKGGDVVGISLERSVEMVVSVLGVLKAGCCYLPLDPSFPDERLNYMFEDSGARVLITQSFLKDKFSNSLDTPTVLLDTEWEEINKYDIEKPSIEIDTQSPAYIIYTSGSTGKPKGVKVQHQAVTNFLQSMSKKPGISEEDRLLGVTTLSFDISGLELFLPLSFGAELVIASTEDIVDGQKLSGLLVMHNITVMQATPATWNILLSSGWKGKKNLKALCGGEAILPRLANSLLSKVESLWNMYGPTETTIWSTCFQIINPEEKILVGTPIDNTKIHILDRNNIQLPIGVVGEVCIGGLGVTKGYHNRPDLTAEKFITFENGQIIYKTGDLGRFLSDGNIELFGRIDNQIKLRGFRIEPGEIESLLSSLPNVKEAVVKVHKFEESDERLVAFLNVESGFNKSEEEIKNVLVKSLPVYMIPSFYQVSEGFPRLPNGKINKKALILELDDSNNKHEINFVSLTETQKKLLTIWGQILKTQDIAPSDNFFNVGGNSLLGIRIINQVREAFGISLTFRELITNSTINQLSVLIDSQTRSSEKAIELVHLTQTTNLPLTKNQKRLWLISKLHPEVPLYIISSTYKFRGSLNREVFEKSFDILFRRHHIMFSVFKEINNEPYCDIVPSKADISFIDYTGLPESEKSEKFIDRINESSTKAFNLEKGPLYRLYLIKTADDEYHFHMSIHHIIFDGWSFGVLIKDLSKIYNSLINSKEVQFEELEFQQYDYAQWESVSEERADSVAFWEENLRGCSPILNFPYDFQRKEKPTNRGSFEEIRLPKTLSDELRRISKEEGSSLFTTLMSAFGVLLNKYSGEDDLNIGLPVAYRPHSKLENIFGMFVNTVVVRLRYEKSVTFRELIKQSNEAAINAISHQDLPFERVVEIVNPERSYETNPLFQIAFAWQNNLGAPVKLEGIRSEGIKGKERTPVFDITLYLWENGEIIEGEIEYSADLLKHETIQRFRDCFLCLISNLVDNPDTAIESIPLISDEERRLIESFNDTQTAYPKDKTIAQLFEEQVELYPDKTAVIFKEEALTYKQLNERANQLARTLRASGVTKNTMVGILAEKSMEMVVGILGIIKAGGGYVPIDPEYPEYRINFIISDSGCKILLIQDKHSKVTVKEVKKIILNSLVSYDQEKTNIEKINTSSALAYIMYTSGTTGKPKGSMIPQYSVIRLVRNTNYIELTCKDRILLTGAIVFDATTFEIWGALLNGGTLYVVPRETILDPNALGEELMKNDITTLWLTSALFTQISEIRTDIFCKLKCLLVGGDVLSASHINKVRKDNPNLKIINGYGPTENTTFSTTYFIDKDFDHNIPIGKPISNSTAYIFDKDMNYQPIGIIGELYLGGEGLSMGYLNRDDLNRIKFVDNPYKPGERLYRTGDFARWLPDGHIEFRGRTDNQLKIRGFRVELEEIESVISEIEGVIETVVKPVKVEEGDYRLVAFLNIPETFNLETKEIVSQIKIKLPAYMVPSAFKLMHGFPKTINGKTDKKALTFDILELDSKSRQDRRDYTPTEIKVHKIWCEALRTEDVSLTDNFFDIGGNSLLAISIMSKIEVAFNISLGLKVFFDNPKIKDLSEAIEIKTEKSVKMESENKKKMMHTRIVKGEL